MDWNEILMTIITTVIIPAVLILGKAAYKAIQENVKDKNVQKYLLIATDCVSDAVADVAQTFVDKISEGEWNEQTKQEAFNIAKTKALEHLGITGQKLLKEALGDFDNWVSSKIEAEVKRLAVSGNGKDT
jgi:hypothetical protein